MSAKDTSEIIKNWFEIAKSVLLILVLAALIWMLVWNRPYLKIAASEMGIERVSAGVLDIALAKSSDELPKSQAALQLANQRLAELEQRYATAVAALAASQQALRLEEGSGEGGQTVRARQLVGEALRQAPTTINTIERARSQIGSAASSTARAIRALPGASDSSVGFGIVFGADQDRDAAEAELTAAKRLGIETPRIFRRQNFLRSVAVFPTRQAAEAALPEMRASDRFRDAYLVNLASWCPDAVLSEDPINCPF